MSGVRVTDIIDHLVQDDVLTLDSLAEIKAGTTERERMRRYVRTIPTRGRCHRASATMNSLLHERFFWGEGAVPGQFQDSAGHSNQMSQSSVEGNYQILKISLPKLGGGGRHLRPFWIWN